MIYIDKHKKVPLYEQIYLGYRKAIEDNTLEKGSLLPPVRSLAKELNVSINTVSKAYQLLLSENYIRSIQGSGYFVRNVKTVQKKSKMESISVSKPSSNDRIQFDFNYETMDSFLFPWSKWRRYLLKAISDESIHENIGYEDKKGCLELRQVLCQHIYRTRGIQCDTDQIIICAGKQYAMDIILDILSPKYNCVGIEDPCLQRVRKAFRDKGKKRISIPITDEGLDVTLLEKSSCNFLYTTPSHNFPAGSVTSLTKRVQLIEWAKRTGSYVIEDDYENEFFEGIQTIPSIYSLDHDDRVIYMHTLSRVLSPSIRCSYIVLPKPLLAAYERRYKYYFTALPLHHQTALAHFIKDGHLERQCRKTRSYNQKRYEKIISFFTEEVSDLVSCIPVSSCTHVLLTVIPCTNAEELLEVMEENGIRLYSAKNFWNTEASVAENIFILGFHGIPEKMLLAACEKIAFILRDFYDMKEEREN